MTKNEIIDFRKEIMFKEIDLIENCITRMANNSFLIKRWAIGIVTAVLALMVRFDDFFCGSVITFFLCLMFWGLDAFYLRLERLYRHKYAWVIKNRLLSDDFILDLNPYIYEQIGDDIINLNYQTVMFSKTLIIFYGSIMLLLLLLTLLSDATVLLKFFLMFCDMFLLYCIRKNWQ